MADLASSSAGRISYCRCVCAPKGALCQRTDSVCCVRDVGIVFSQGSLGLIPRDRKFLRLAQRRPPPAHATFCPSAIVRQFTIRPAPSQEYAFERADIALAVAQPILPGALASDGGSASRWALLWRLAKSFQTLEHSLDRHRAIVRQPASAASSHSSRPRSKCRRSAVARGPAACCSAYSRLAMQSRKNSPCHAPFQKQ
jgi:hypothetical protein